MDEYGNAFISMIFGTKDCKKVLAFGLLPKEIALMAIFSTPKDTTLAPALQESGLDRLHSQHHGVVKLSSEPRKNPGYLGFIGDYTTQLYCDYDKPL